MMMNSSRLGEAMMKLGRYNRLIGTVISGKITLGINKVKLILSSPPDTPRLSRHCVECAAASLITLARRLTGTEVNPLAVAFTGQTPESDCEYRRIFRCPVAFGQRESCLVLDPRTGAIPLPSPNQELLAYFEEYARSYLEEIEESGAVSSRVTRILLSRLDSRALSLRTVAREIALSARTLQNRLEEEGVIFRDLLLKTRKNLVAKYLRDKHTIEEISCMLGYSEASAFSRASKK